MNIEQIKKAFLENEGKCLSVFAAKSDNLLLTSRSIKSDDNDFRLPFQRDRDRIIHSRAFRRLMHKTQVFNANKGDHYRNRLTHTMEVSQIARSLSKMLGLNEELTEAIALGHDVGHTPFGHIGERTLHMIISGRMRTDDAEFSDVNYGGFKHNYQSIQILDNIEKRSTSYNGLNLTFAVREGILKHTGQNIKLSPSMTDNVTYSSLNLENMNIDSCSITLEGQVVAIADEIAQCTHDLEDGIRSKIIGIDDLLKDKLVKLILNVNGIDPSELKETVDFRNMLIRQMVGYLISDVYENAKKKLTILSEEKKVPLYKNVEDVFKEKIIDFSNEPETKIKENQKALSKFITRIVIASQEVTQADRKAEYLIKKLYKAYYQHPQQLPDYILKRYYHKQGKSFNRLDIEGDTPSLQSNAEFIRLICDHISGMTDQFASREYKKLYEPEYF